MIIDGKKIADELVAAAGRRVAATGKTVTLAVVLVGDNPASKVYVRNKMRACEKAGITSRQFHMPADSSEESVLGKIRELNDDPQTRGILVQLPLPAAIDADKVLETISPDKDVDGFHAVHMGRLASNLPSLQPCTPAGCMELLRKSGATIAGANAVVVGRSNIVGKPMALMLINAGATVTVCNSKTRDMGAITRRADILVVAIGRANYISGDMIKPGATVIDVGINRISDGSLAGDVDFASARDVAAAITPVPGGVGPMTVAMLINNVLSIAGV